MQITINLNEDDVRVCKSIVAGQTHFVINSTCIEDAVISGILTQISKKVLLEDNIATQNIPLGQSRITVSDKDGNVIRLSEAEAKADATIQIIREAVGLTINPTINPQEDK